MPILESTRDILAVYLHEFTNNKPIYCSHSHSLQKNFTNHRLIINTVSSEYLCLENQPNSGADYLSSPCSLGNHISVRTLKVSLDFLN
jgi:hypothetical protein